MSYASPYQDRYWKEFYQLKVHVNYLEIYSEKSELRDKTVNIFLAITSSSSICSWAIWNEYGFIWGSIIALSQLINAIKIFLPYRNRLKGIGKILPELEELLVFCERKWFDVAEGKLTEEEINRLQFDIRRKKIQSVRRHLGGSALPLKEKYFDKSKELSNTYISNFYPMEKQNE